MLSNKAKLSNVFQKVATLQEEEKELFFEFHPYFVVTLSAKKSIGVNVTNDNDVVVELKNDDIMAELMKMDRNPQDADIGSTHNSAPGGQGRQSQA
ncbi:hypothetical protein HDU79_004102, partial [Rhizoclosmatium sp. JEL0117]